MTNRPGSPLRAALLAALVAFTPAVAATATSTPANALAAIPATPAGAGLSAFGYAFKFATAIGSDADDRDKSQLGVITDLIAAGALDDAAGRIEAMDGWRRGVAYADLATALARAGRKEEARTYVNRAQEFRKTVEEWPNQRIGAHIAEALAALSDVEGAREIAAGLATEDRQYAGRAVTTVASAQAARGEFAAALETLKKIDQEIDYDIVWWRTAGYLEIARQKNRTPKERQEALLAARRSAEGIPGWKEAEALESIAGEMLVGGDTPGAREALHKADTLLHALPPATPMRAPLLSNLARAWARAGDARRARGLLSQAERAVTDELRIDQPGIWANLAASYDAIGNEPEKQRLLDRALGSAQGLENARPRALAVVTICRALGQHGIDPDDAARMRLDALYDGLKAPW